MLKQLVALVLFTLVSFGSQAQYSYGYKTEYNYSNHYANPGYSSTNLNTSGMGSTISQMQKDQESNTQSGTMRKMTPEEHDLLITLFELMGLVIVVLFGSLFFYNRR